MTHWSTISSLGEIKMLPDCLYVLDFDETVAYFDNINRDWWKARFQHHYTAHGDAPLADKLALQDWAKHISFAGTDVHHVDKQGFDNIVSYVQADPGSHLIILTARDISLKDVTEGHLSTISPNHSIDIIFSSGGNKGLKLNEYLKAKSTGNRYENIIFVDDLHKNLVDFKGVHTDAHCYHMSGAAPPRGAF